MTLQYFLSYFYAFNFIPVHAFQAYDEDGYPMEDDDEWDDDDNDEGDDNDDYYSDDDDFDEDDWE